MNVNTNHAKVDPDGILEYAPTEYLNVNGLDIYDPLGGYAVTQGGRRGVCVSDKIQLYFDQDGATLVPFRTV